MLSGATVEPAKLAAESLFKSPGGLGEIGGVAASIERRNWMSCRLSLVLCSRSVPPVPAERCATFCITASRESAEPLWKKVWGNANSDSREGGLKPAAPSGGGATLARTSLVAAALKVPTGRSSAINWPALSKLASGGGVARTLLTLHCGPP